MSLDFHEVVAGIRSGTHAVIDLDAYTRNVEVLRSLVAPDAALMAVVKGDAYGHGAIECGRAALDAGASMLGVARIQEALYLRHAGLTGAIVVIGPPTLGEIELALEHDITLTVGSHSSVRNLLDHVGEGRSARVHVKFDTGMNRYGFNAAELLGVVEQLSASPFVEVDGLYTHFSSADELDRTPTEQQIDRFWAGVAVLEARGLRPRYLHTSNSAGILTGQWRGTNLVRSGVATYGLSPSPEVPVDDRFQPIMAIKSVVSRRTTLLAGGAVSYSQRYRASVDEPIAAVPIGYADGLPRLRNEGWFVVGGKTAPIRGSVCMDQTVVGLQAEADEGETVLVIGDGTAGEMTYDDIAQMLDTVNYEIASRVMARVPRLYLRGGQVVTWERVLTGERGHSGA